MGRVVVRLGSKTLAEVEGRIIIKLGSATGNNSDVNSYVLNFKLLMVDS